MRISSEQTQQVLGTTGLKGPKANKASTGPGAASAPDAVSVSTMGKEIGKAMQVLSNIPDIRADRVAELKARIEAGTYNVPARDIAESVLRHAADRLV